jgi:ribosome modulation factor
MDSLTRKAISLGVEAGITGKKPEANPFNKVRQPRFYNTWEDARQEAAKTAAASVEG